MHGRRKRRPQHNLALPDDLELRAVVVFVIGHGSSVSELLIRGAQIRLRPSLASSPSQIPVEKREKEERRTAGGRPRVRLATAAADTDKGSEESKCTVKWKRLWSLKHDPSLGNSARENNSIYPRYKYPMQLNRPFVIIQKKFMPKCLQHHNQGQGASNTCSYQEDGVRQSRYSCIRPTACKKSDEETVSPRQHRIVKNNLLVRRP